MATSQNCLHCTTKRSVSSSKEACKDIRLLKSTLFKVRLSHPEALASENGLGQKGRGVVEESGRDGENTSAGLGTH